MSDRTAGTRRARRTALVSLGLARELPTPLHRQLYDQLREAILAGRLAPGARLPPTRSLAAEMDLSRNTVATAFEPLLSEGDVEGRVGARAEGHKSELQSKNNSSLSVLRRKKKKHRS